MNQDISTKSVGSFFQGHDINAATLNASCIALGSYLNQRYPDVTVLKAEVSNFSDEYFDPLAMTILSANFSLVKQWYQGYVTETTREVSGENTQPREVRRTG